MREPPPGSGADTQGGSAGGAPSYILAAKPLLGLEVVLSCFDIVAHQVNKTTLSRILVCTYSSFHFRSGPILKT